MIKSTFCTAVKSSLKNAKIQNSCLNLRKLSTWTSFASAFNTRPRRKFNLKNLRSGNKGLFGIPQLTDYTGFYLLRQRVEEDVSRLVEEATSPVRKRKIVEVFDELSNTLCKVADMSDFVRTAHPDSQFAAAAEDTCVALSSLVEKLNTDTSLHKSLKTVVQEGDVVPTDSVDRRVTELFMFDFEQSGIHLDEEKRKEFVQLNGQIHMAGTFFQRGAQRPVAVPKENLPENLRHVFGIDGSNITVTGLFSDHYSSMVREAAYRIFLHPDDHQIGLLESFLSARHRLARLVDFPTFSHRANKGTMMENPENIVQFLEKLAEVLKPRAQKDFASMLRLKQQQEGKDTQIMPWDPPYLTAMARQNQNELSAYEMTAYFSLGGVMEGLNGLFQGLFGVSLHHVEMEEGESWSNDVYKVAVVHSKEGVLGYIYCDFFDRPGKSGQDCHYTIQGGRRNADGSYQFPIVVLQLSLPGPGSSSVPALLSSGNVDNLFHEFGHAMHSMLGRTQYQHVTGTRCSTDFAEVPSVLMEFFAADPKVIGSFARHYKTGAPMGASDINNLCSSKKLYMASEMQQQVFFSMLDQMYHGTHPLPGSTSDILASTQAKYYGVPHISGTAWQQRFNHLVGYGARYYSYLVSRAVASQLWHTCFKADPFDRKMGTRYREEVLAHGGEKHPTNIVTDMLGNAPTVDNLVDSLLMDLDGLND